MYIKRHAQQQELALTCEEARLVLKAKLVSPVKVSIIGTAGRKEDANKMSRALYFKMCRYAINYLDKLGLQPEEVELISGGAAWSDHVAVSLYLNARAKNLILHLPAKFTNSEDAPRFYGNKSAEIANHYHIAFSIKMKGTTMDGIRRALDQGADAKAYKDFKIRNLEVAKCDLMIAFTWGESKDKPKDGGTSHTWNNSNATVKIHVPLKEL